MAPTEYYAHISEDGRHETVEQHLHDTALLAQQFAAAFDSAEMGRLTGLAHDIGKYSAAFQRRLKGSTERVDHSTAGAWECMKLQNAPAAYVVAAHHGGLPDGGSKGDSGEGRSFFAKINRARSGRLEPYPDWPGKLAPAAPPSFLQRPGKLDLAFYIRMLYSALVDADFLATEAFMQNQNRTGLHTNMAVLSQFLNDYTKGWFPPKGELNKQRCAILDQCRQAGQTEPPGLFTLTVPTGGGKTISSLAFALEHAKSHGLRRIIYVIPYTSIIEQTASVLRGIFGEEAVLEHHSGVVYDLGSEATPAAMRLAQATENWDAPIVVTTAVQFFESLYANRSSKCRKLHNIAGSVVIFDEAQMLPVPYLRPCVSAIAQLVEHYHVSAVLCTATQPALEPVFREIGSGLQARELCPPGLYDPAVFRRVRFENAGKLSTDTLAEKLNSQPQALCIVNSRAAAADLYSRLGGEGTFHLSTLMYPAHRQKVLTEIRSRLKSGLPCRVVSTSLIEAGVDVDFPAVYRELAGLDSILQAAGRCNREGHRPAENSTVTVFRGERKAPPIFSIPVAAAEAAMKRFEDFSSAEAISFYFRQLLELKGSTALDQNGILPLIESTLLPFETVAERFHLIDSPTKAIYIPCAENEQLLDQLCSGLRNRSLMRSLNRYGVSVYEQHFNALLSGGALQLLEDGCAILTNAGLYSEETGLSLAMDSGCALFV